MNEPKKRRVAIVTDSTADLPPNLVTQYDIHVVPQILIMGDKTWQDGVDIDPPTFYELLRTSSSFPSTSQPSVASFQALFSQLADQAEGIVAILVSDELSGTLNSARAARDTLPDIPIEIIDSRGVSMQLGLIVLAAARAAAQGQDLHAVASTARALVGRVRVYFVVDTLEYLHRGGRIGAATRLFGSALNLKPVLQVYDGIVQPVAKIRSRRKALERVYELVGEEVSNAQQLHMAVLHIAAPQEAAQLRDYLQDHFQPANLYLSECGPVVGAHAGPGTVGVAYYTGE
jgi:DegV family protein with EDD domain